MVVDAGRTIKTLDGRNMIRTEVLELFLILLSHDVFVSLSQTKLLLVVLCQLLLVLYFVFVHPAELMSAGLFAIEIGDESIDALL